MILRVLTLMLLTLVLVSCGEKKSTVPVKLKILQSGITSGAIALNGGILIMGKSEDKLNSFRLGVGSSSTEISLDLVKGKWEFAAIGWVGGSGILTDSNKCAYTGFVDLTEAESVVNFNFTTARCAQSFNGRAFSNAAFLSEAVPGEFFKFNPVLCYESTVANMNNTYCDVSANPSNLSSFRIVYPGEIKGQVTGKLTSLVSGCFTVMGGIYPSLPMTSLGSDSPLGFELQFFTNDVCGGAPVNYSFKGGAINNYSAPVTHSFLPYSSYYTYFFMNPGPLHDARVPNSLSTLMNITSAVLGGVNYYVNNQNVTYTISTPHPESARQMCLTETTCTAEDWRPLTNSGTFTLLAGDGAHTIKLFHRNVFGDVSVSPSTATVNLVTTNMSFSSLGFSENPGISVTPNWIGASVNDELVLNTRLRMCDTSACAVVYLDLIGGLVLSSGNVQIIPSMLIASIPTGALYIKMEITDIFGATQYLTWTPTAVHGLVKP